MRKIATTALVLSLAFAAAAQARQDETQVPGTVAYFIMHTAERQAMDRQCALRTGRPRECQAAQKADEYVSLAAAKQRVAAGRFGQGSVDSPLYYDNWPIARANVLRECAHPTTPENPLFEPTKSMCQAAQASAAGR
jgi:hypothetical protein